MSLFHIGTELRRFGHGILPRLAVIVIMCLPLLFGGLFVWAYYDPIGHLNKLPIAMVNSDKGGKLPDGTPLNAGDQVMEEIKNNDRINAIPVSADEAKRGIADGTYYFGMEIPEDFSAAATSVEAEKPRSATINVVFNNRNGMIPTALGNQVTMTVVDMISATLGSQVAKQLLFGFGTIGEGMDKAADGASQLDQGVGSAKDGADRLAQGTGTLDDSMGEAQDGVKQLQDGARRLDDGLGQALDGSQRLTKGLAQLQAATNALGAGASQISGGVDQVADMVGSVDDAREALLAPLVNISAQLRDQGLTVLADQADAAIEGVRNTGLDSDTLNQIQQLQDGARELASQLSDPASQYLDGMNQAAEGSQSLTDGLVQLKQGSAQLVVGVDRLADGTSRLAAGTHQLRVGAQALQDGLVQLDEGTGQLSLRISEGAQQVPRWEGDRLDSASGAVGQAAKRVIAGQELTKFGVGLAPFFLSLAMFMGATVVFMVMRPLQRRALDSGMSPLRAMLASYLPAMLVGQAQAINVWLVSHFLVGLEAARPGWLLVSLMGISAVFVSITHAINSLLGPAAGRVVCLMLMALQLVSSGGLYPVETQPKFLQWFNTYDPITYSVNLTRHFMVDGTGGVDNRGYQAVGVLILVALIAWALSTFSAWKHRVVQHKDLHPELSL